MENKILGLLLEITVSSGIIYCVIALFKKAFRQKISPFLQYALWSILILRLILPVTFDVDFRLIQIDMPPQNAAPIETAAQAEEQYTTLQPQRIIKTNVTGAAPTFTLSSEQNKTEIISSTVNNEDETPAFAKRLTWQQWVLLVCVSGIIISSVKLILSSVRLKKRLDIATVRTPDYLKRIFAKCRRQLRVKKRIPLLTVADIKTPALTLSFFPKVIIPQEMAVRANEQEIYFALIHELTHYKRKDYLCCILLQALQTVYWFNPFIWLSVKAIRMDMESACDASVVKNMEPPVIADYAKALIKLSSEARLNYALGMALDSTFKTVEKRIRGIYMIKKSKPRVRFAALFMAFVIGVLCFTTACQPSQINGPTPTNSETGVQSFNLDNNNQQSAAPTGQQAQTPYQAPEHWTDVYTDGDITLNVDANVILPKDTGFATAIAKPVRFSQDYVDQLVDYFAMGRKLFQLPLLMPKSQAEDWLSELKKERSNETDTNSIAVLDRQIAETEEYLKTAEEKPGLKYVDSTLTYKSDEINSMNDEGEKNFLYVGIEGGGNPNYSFAEPNVEYIRLRNGESLETPILNATLFEYSDGAKFIYEPSYLIPLSQATSSGENTTESGTAADSLSVSEVDETKLAENMNPVDWEKIAQTTAMTEIEALETTENLLKVLNIQGLTLSKVGRTAFYDADGNPTIGGYVLEYVPEINGVPCSGWLSYGYAGEDGGSVWTDYETEVLTIILNEDGIHYMEWLYPVNITDIEPVQTELLPFDDVKNAVTEQIIGQIKRDISAKIIQTDSETTSLNFDLTDIGLYEEYGSTQIDGDKFPVVPTWVCSVRGSNIYKNGNKMVYYTHIYKINAINGKLFGDNSAANGEAINAGNVEDGNATAEFAIQAPTVEESAIWREDNRLKYVFAVYNPNKEFAVLAPSVNVRAYDKSGNIISDEIVTGQYILPESYWYCAEPSREEVSKEPAEAEFIVMATSDVAYVKPDEIQNKAQDVKVEIDKADKTGIYGNGIYPTGEKARPVNVIALYRDDNGKLKGAYRMTLNSTLEDGITAPIKIIFDGDEKYVTDNVEFHVQPWG